MMDNSLDKKADNSIINIDKTKIKEIDSKIDLEKNKMKNLDDMEEIFVSLNKNISKCVELLGKSIKGNNITKRLNSIEEENKNNFARSIQNIEFEREKVKSNLSSLNDEKEDYEQKIKEENKNKLDEERKNKDDN